MGAIGGSKKVKPFCGIIYSDNCIKDKAFAQLEARLGKIDSESKTVDFEQFTSYYNPEMGSGLKRLWISFEKLISADELAGIKVFTNAVEDGFAAVCSADSSAACAKNKKRRINIDPGYITPANVVLASTKDFSHRIYIGSGIYAEVTTIYKKGSYEKLPWSYPDYMSKTSTDFLLKARSVLLLRIKEAPSQGD
jgi:hypothetical protein